MLRPHMPLEIVLPWKSLSISFRVFASLHRTEVQGRGWEVVFTMDGINVTLDVICKLKPVVETLGIWTFVWSSVHIAVHPQLAWHRESEGTVFADMLWDIRPLWRCISRTHRSWDCFLIMVVGELK